MSHTLAVITVVYENYTVLGDFFASFEKQTNKDFIIFVIDTSKQPKLVQSRTLNVVHMTTKNYGYADAINVGIKTAQHKKVSHFAIINSDTYVDSRFVDEILKSLSDHPRAIIGGKIYYAPHCEFHQTRYQESEKGKILWYAGGNIDWKHAIAHHRGVDEVDRGQYNYEEKTDFITGCFMCYIDYVVNAVGTWDKSYFLYFEDADFCERAKRKGIKLIYNPQIVLWHKNAQSTGGSGSQIHITNQEKNRMMFAIRYAPIKTTFHIIWNYFVKKLSSG